MNNMHGNNQNNNKKSFFKHGIGMAICCLLPILLLAAIPLLGIKEGGALSLLATLICPLGMILMMVFMRHSGKDSSCHDNKQIEETSTEANS